MAYVYFFRVTQPHGFLSNWYMADMIIDGTKYNCVEQYMMSQKALLFNDLSIANKIMNSNSPKVIKALGKEVRDFDYRIWNEHKYNIVKKGVRAKFDCNIGLKSIFMRYPADSIFVECSPWDKIWGIGIDLYDQRKNDESKWRGENLLGKILTDVRREYEDEKRC